jgi:indolepyruvate decarboxylase
MTDINLGGDTARLDLPNSISVTSEQLRIRRHHYHDVSLEAFLKALTAHSFDVAERKIPESLKRRREPFRLEPDRALEMSRMMSRINDSLDENTIVIADIGDSLFAATELQVPGRTEFISPAYYTSMGFAVPAALGACVARPESRVVAICGDGAFQMTGMELSTVVRRGFSPIVIVVNNEGYGTERMLHPGDWKYNDIHSWKYHLLPQVLGGGKGYEVFTERDFDAALKKAWDDRSGLSLIHVHVAVDDASQPLRRMAERLGSHV